MDIPTQLELCLYDQLDSELATYFLTFIVIPTPFLKFNLFLVVYESIMNNWIVSVINANILVRILYKQEQITRDTTTHNAIHNLH